MPFNDHMPSEPSHASSPSGPLSTMPIDPPAVPTSAVPPPKGSWSGVLATAGLVAVGVLLLGGAVVPWWLSEPSRVTAWISRNVPNLHGRVEMARATFTWLGPIVFEDLVVVPANGAREPVVIKRIEAEHGIAAFLISGGDVGRVSVEGLEAHVVFDEQRDSNVTGLFVDPANPEQGHGPPRKTPLRMVLDVVDARVRIEGPWSADPWISDPIDVELRLAQTPSGDASEWTLHPTTILEEAELEPSVAQGVLAYIAPVLADATRTSGRFSLALDGGTFPVGVPEKSMFSGTLTMHAVDLGPGPLVTGILGALPGRIQVPTSIRVADDSQIVFRMEDRRMWHEGLEFGFPLPRGGSRLDLSSSGSVGLDDRVLDIKLALPFPADLPADRPVLASLGGKTVSLGIGGKLGEPRVDFDGSIRGVAADVIVSTIDRLLNRSAGAAPPTSAPQTTTAKRQSSPPPRPGWSPETGKAADEAGAVADDASGSAEVIPPPPPRPGWSPIKRPGLGPQAGAAFAEGAGSARPAVKDRDSEAGQPPAEFAGGSEARPLDGSADAAGDAQPPKQGTAQIIDQLKDRLAPQMADTPQTDRVIDLVGGLIDEVARRRAQRAAEAANGAQQGQTAPPGAQAPGVAAPPGPAAGPLGGGPRRGRILRRLLQPDQPAPSAAPGSGP